MFAPSDGLLPGASAQKPVGEGVRSALVPVQILPRQRGKKMSWTWHGD